MNKLLLRVAVICLAAGVAQVQAQSQQKQKTQQAEQQVRMTLHNESHSGQYIPREIYGQFAEHLGRCIYGGIWVGEESDIPNEKGYRVDVLEALRALKVPVLRWPGGCFADEYHWMDGIGPREKRPKMVNTNWGGTVEDNSFGTHEFLNFCELLGCEPYISGNVGSGSVEELSKWVEYMTSNADSPMANLRRQNGREKPWRVKYIGVGNESWGCGGNMYPEYYSDLYRRYATYCREYDGNRLYKIASGANTSDYNWTEVLMRRVGNQMNGISLHYYTVFDWNRKGSATEFTAEDWYAAMGRCSEIENIIRQHCGVMDRYDPARRIGLMVDEWGTWWDEEPGTVRGHLYQQNTMRDAMVAALSLNIFHKFTDRVRMANIAQMVNVLQAMILTQDDKMVLTPTYYVFQMYVPHQNGEIIPLYFEPTTMRNRYRNEVDLLSATASRAKDGTVTLTLANVDLEKAQNISITLDDDTRHDVSARILTAESMNAHNTFENPDVVKCKAFEGVSASKGVVEVTVPAMSIVSVTIK